MIGNLLRKARLLTLAMIITGVCSIATAKETSTTLGYCFGNVPSDQAGDFGSSKSDVEVSAAIFLPSSFMKAFDGNEIKAVKAGLRSQTYIDVVRVWVRASLDGENLASGEVTEADGGVIVKGWNEVSLDAPVKISGESAGLYIGFTYHQTRKGLGMSVVPTSTVEPVDGGLWEQIGDGEWKDRSDEGTLALEAIVEGDALPAAFVRLVKTNCDEIYSISDKVLKGQLKLHNYGCEAIDGFDVFCMINGSDDVYKQHMATSIGASTTGEYTYEIEPTCIVDNEPEYRTITVGAANFNGGDAKIWETNTSSAEFRVLARHIARQVLFEEFTSEYCMKCPDAAVMIEQLLSSEPYKGNINMVCHHSGYVDDWLTTDFSKEYEWFYNGYGYAPAFLIDRFTSEDTKMYGDEDSPVFIAQAYEQLTKVVDARLAEPANVSINMSAKLDGKHLTVKVSGDKTKTELTRNPARLAVVVTEDNIKPVYQMGASADFMHQHVARLVNSTWGDVINWKGNDYDYSCEFDIPENYEMKNLRVVAYIWDFESQKTNGSEVMNSASIGYNDFETTGVGELTTEMDSELFTLEGLKAAKDHRGIVIERKADGSYKKQIMR